MASCGHLVAGRVVASSWGFLAGISSQQWWWLWCHGFIVVEVLLAAMHPGWALL